MSKNYDIAGMRERLSEQLETLSITMRAASLNADLGPGYVHSILKNGQEPTVAKLAAICSENGISFPYVMFGISMSPATQELLDLVERNPSARDGIVAILRQTSTEQQ